MGSRRASFAVRPEDVLLFERGRRAAADHRAQPARRARGRRASRAGPTNHVVLDADGVRLAASVSRAASADLELTPGRDVLAVFKATAVRWRLEPLGESGARATDRW